MNGTQNPTKSIIALIIVLAVWLGLVYEPLYAAVSIWIGNEIYNHCLVVIPASIYLIYERKNLLDWSLARMSWLAVAVFFVQLVFYIVATAAEIQLFRHIAIFAMLPTIVWMFIGDKLAWQLRFPLAFVLFGVPVGEELIPILQEITADLSVMLLNASGIPLFRSGLYIQIPQGKFLVAEACSGVSFLIASIVLGSLYANMNLVTWQRRWAFVALSIVFPILANAVRVYGIIYIAYLTDMEYAAGADHLIYGWFFFAFVLVCLFLIGETIRRFERRSLAAKATGTTSDTDRENSKTSILMPINIAILVAALVLIVLAQIQSSRMQLDVTETEVVLKKANLRFQESRYQPEVLWKPRFVGNNAERMIHLDVNGNRIDFYQAYFNGSEGKLVSSLHRMYEQDRWTRVNVQNQQIGDYTVKREFITTSVGVKKQLLYWYVVNGKIVSSYKDVKLSQFLRTLKGEPSDAFVMAVAIDTEKSLVNLDPALEIAAKYVLDNVDDIAVVE